MRPSLLIVAIAFVIPWRSPAAPTPNAELPVAAPANSNFRGPDRVLGKTARRATDLIVYSPNGQLLAAGGTDKIVRVWDARPGEKTSGELRQSLAVESPSVNALTFSLDGSTLFVVTEDQKLNAWTVANGKSVPTAPLKANPRVSMFRPGIDWQLAECTAVGAKLWNLRTGDPIREFLTAIGEPTRALAFTPDGKYIFGVTRGGNIWQWDAATGAKVRIIETRLPIVGLVASSTQVAGASVRGGVRVWRLADGVEGQSFDGNWPATISPSGEMLATTIDRTTILWNINTGASVGVLDSSPSDVVAAAFSPNRQNFATADREGNVCYWTLPSASPPAGPPVQR